LDKGTVTYPKAKDYQEMKIAGLLLAESEDEGSDDSESEESDDFASEESDDEGTCSQDSGSDDSCSELKGAEEECWDEEELVE
jgi:hypothetical protein